MTLGVAPGTGTPAGWSQLRPRHSWKLRAQVPLREREHLADAQPSPPKQHDQDAGSPAVRSPAARMTATTSSTVGGSAGQLRNLFHDERRESPASSPATSGIEKRRTSHPHRIALRTRRPPRMESGSGVCLEVLAVWTPFLPCLSRYWGQFPASPERDGSRGVASLVPDYDAPMDGPNAATREIDAFEKAMSTEKLTERVLTESMGRMLAADPQAAGRFEAVLIGQLAQRLPPNNRARCLVEHDYYLGLRSGWRQRRADFVFCSFNYQRVVVVEAKLSAPTARMQIADAQRIDLRDVTQVRVKAERYVALIANRALVPRDKTNFRRWLGATTWHSLLPDVADLSLDPPSDTVGSVRA